MCHSTPYIDVTFLILKNMECPKRNRAKVGAEKHEENCPPYNTMFRIFFFRPCGVQKFHQNNAIPSFQRMKIHFLCCSSCININSGSGYQSWYKMSRETENTTLFVVSVTLTLKTKKHNRAPRVGTRPTIEADLKRPE